MKISRNWYPYALQSARMFWMELYDLWNIKKM
jgi:hypothetical protein